MAKTDLPVAPNGQQLSTTVNANFAKIKTILNDKVLWRDNPVGEPNQLEQDLDLNGNDILNVESITTNTIDADKILLAGQDYNATLAGLYADTAEARDAASSSAEVAVNAAAKAEVIYSRVETGLGAPGDVFSTTVAAVYAVTENPDLYTRVQIIERANSWWDVVTGETPDGFGIIAAGVKQLKLIRKKAMCIEEFGASTSSIDSTAVINYALNFIDGFGAKLSQASDGYFNCLNALVKNKTTVSGLKLKSLVAVSSGEFVIGFAPSSSNSKIKLCEIDGDKVNQTVSAYGINMDGEGNTAFKNYIFDTKRDAVSIEPGSVNVSVIKNKIRTPDGRGVSVKPSSTLVTYSPDIAFNDVEDTGSSGIAYIAGDGVTPGAGVHDGKIRYNKVKNTGLLGVAGGIGGYSPNNRNILCEHNTLENCNNHMHHFGGNGIKILYNKGKGFTNSAIMLRNWPNTTGGAPLMQDCWIIGNEVEDVTDAAFSGAGYGIQIVNCKNVFVTDNKINNTSNHGILIEGEGLSNTVRCENIQISGGSVEGSGEKGLAIWKSDKVTVTGGSYIGSTEQNIHIQGSTFVKVTGSFANGSIEDEGVRVTSAALGTKTLTNVEIVGVTANDNATHGIYISSGLNGIRVQNNTMLGNTVGAYNSPAGLTNSYVSDNITN